MKVNPFEYQLAGLSWWSTNCFFH